MQETTKIQLEATIIAFYNTNTSAIDYKLYPKGYAWYADDNEVCIDQHFPINLEVPYFNETELQQKAVDTLREKQRKVYAEAEKEHAKLQEKIDALLLLDWKG